MGKTGKTIFLVSIILYFPLVQSYAPHVYSKDVVTVNDVLITGLNNHTIVSTDAYEFRFDKDSLYWNVSRNGSPESFLKKAKWKLYFNGTDLEAESEIYNSTNEGVYYWANSTFDGGIFFNFTSASKGKAPTVMEYFWFYPRYFSVQLKVINTVSSSVIYVEKSQYIDNSVSSVRTGDSTNTNFVFWGYKKRYQAQEVADAEPPLFMYSNKTDEGLVIAPFKPSWTNHVTASYAAGSDFRLSYELMADTTNADDITVAENNQIELDRVFFQFTSADINQAFEDYAALFSTTHTLRPFKGSQTYWLTWYAGGGETGENITETNILSNATWIKDNLKPYYGFDGVLIDATITDEVGDWLNYSRTRFPSGLTVLVDRIHAMGLKVGLWIAPLMAERDGWINRTHPEAIAKNKTGTPLSSQMRLGQTEHYIYYLDPFDPWVQDRLRLVNQEISNWGFDFVKMDFLSGPLYELFEENKTRYMIMEQIFKAVIADLDDRIVVTSLVGAFYNPALIVNYVDRIWVYGPDLWAYTPDGQIASNLLWKYDALANLVPFIRHFNLTVDSDALGRLSTQPPLPFSLAKFYSTYATVGGGTFEIGERLSTMDSNTLALYKKHLPFVSEKWRPVEWNSISQARPPRIWLYNATIDGKQYYYVALFNPESSSKTITIDLTGQLKLPSGTYLVMNQYNSTFLGEHRSSIDIDIDANETVMLTLTQKASTPIFLMRSDHMIASSKFISSLVVEGRLILRFQGDPETWTHIIMFSEVEPVYVLYNDSEMARLFDSYDFQSNEEACWYYNPTSRLLHAKTLQNSLVTIVVSIVDDIPPVIWEVEHLPEQVFYDQNVKLVANVTDRHSSLETVILHYSKESIEYDLTMSINGDGLYEAEIPANPYGTLVEYEVSATDTWGNSAMSERESYSVADEISPDIRTPNLLPEYPLENQEVVVTAEVYEPSGASGLRAATLWFGIDSQWSFRDMTIEGGNATAVIPGASRNASVEYFIEAWDNAGNRAITFTYGYTVRPPDTWLTTALTYLVTIGFVLALLFGSYLIFRTKKTRARRLCINQRLLRLICRVLLAIFAAAVSGRVSCLVLNDLRSLNTLACRE